MKRLAVLTSHPIQYYGPLFRELARRVDLHVFFAHQQTPEQQAAAGFGTTFDWDVDLTSGYEHTFLRNVAPSPSVSRFAGSDTPEIKTRLAEGRFDAVLSLGWHLKALLQGVLAAKQLKLPVMVRGDSQLGGPRSPIKRMVKAAAYPFLLRQFDAALYVGQRSREYYEHYAYPEERLFFSPHCIDTDWFAKRATRQSRLELRARLGIRPTTGVVLLAGKLLTLKRPLELVDACALLQRQGRDVELLVAGSGELADPMRERAKGLGLPTHMLGFQNQSEMPAAFAAADVLALPSSRETWGLVANEALASGTPIVVSDAAGCAPDLAADGVVGRSFPSGDTAALAAALREVLDTPPNILDIRSLSERYSLSAAADGVDSAMAYVASRRFRVEE